MADAAAARAPATSPMLSVRGLNAWYGESHILHGVDFAVNEGEVVTLLGRNGAGRTTTLRAIVGLTGTRLSGGEQQMLAVARILRTGARLLLLDEISEGLAPVIV